MKNKKNPSGSHRVPVKLTTEVQKDVERLAREANVTPSHFVEMLVEGDLKKEGLIEPMPQAKQSGKRPQGTPRILRLNAETALALDKAIEWMNSRLAPRRATNTPCYEGRSRLRKVNQLIQAMSEAVVNYQPPHEMGFYFPLVFEARNETREEQELRVMLQKMSAGELEGDGIKPTNPDL